MKKRIALLLAALLLSTVALAEALPDTSRIADASEMTDVQDIVPEGMTPVTADMLSDGVYPVEVEASSPMFKVTACEITVAGGGLRATLHMKSDAYAYMYPGTAEAASEAPFEALIPLGDDRTFALPVDSLDSGFVCAAFSARKQAWYPRTLLFRADSLPAQAWKRLTTAESLGLADGDYSCPVTLVGSGKTALLSPAALHVADGNCTADIVFTTSRIDYVIVDGVKYTPTATDGGAAFTVPVGAFDVGLAITVDSTALTPAVEVPCTMTFDSAGLAQ